MNTGICSICRRQICLECLHHFGIVATVTVRLNWCAGAGRQHCWWESSEPVISRTPTHEKKWYRWQLECLNVELFKRFSSSEYKKSNLYSNIQFVASNTILGSSLVGSLVTNIHRKKLHSTLWIIKLNKRMTRLLVSSNRFWVNSEECVSHVSINRAAFLTFLLEN